MPVAGRIQGDHEAMTSTPDLTIEPLTPDRFADVATLFEEGGDPKWCWCAYFRVRGVDFSGAAKARHRSVLQTAVDDGVALRRAPGLVAYEGVDAVGWISIGPREDYERLAHSTVLAPIDERPVWSIVCFVVARRARGRGVAKALLDAGVGYARSHGATMLEAYPVELPEGGRIASSDVYRGTLAMFERAGFEVAARRQRNASTPARPIVRLDLSAAAAS
jgi:GNAT superfamily N-acetyltransferase